MERRLMIDVAADRQTYGRLEISNTGLVRSAQNVADAVTKPKKCLDLNDPIYSGAILNYVDEWTIRRDVVQREFEGGECSSI